MSDSDELDYLDDLHEHLPEAIVTIIYYVMCDFFLLVRNFLGYLVNNCKRYPIPILLLTVFMVTIMMEILDSYYPNYTNKVLLCNTKEPIPYLVSSIKYAIMCSFNLVVDYLLDVLLVFKCSLDTIYYVFLVIVNYQHKVTLIIAIMNLVLPTLALMKAIRVTNRQEQLEKYHNSTIIKYKTDTCVVCLDREPKVGIFPCGHECLCLKCSSMYRKNYRGMNTNKCPLCRKEITFISNLVNIDNSEIIKNLGCTFH
jgi:hypothetical protein